MGVFGAPVVLLILSASFEAGYQGERGGHWLYHLYSGWAGLALVPLYAAASAYVASALGPRASPLRRGRGCILTYALLATSVWHAFAALALKSTKDMIGEFQFAAVFPALAAIEYAMFVRAFQAGRPVEYPGLARWWHWLGALTTTLVAKCVLAFDFYTRLPTERPPGYGDCFVVGAAARGHRNVVRSHYDNASGQYINSQLLTLRAFEAELRIRYPDTHQWMRRLYNRVGPRAARLLANAVLADAAYFSLKPLEWSTRAWLTRRTGVLNRDEQNDEVGIQSSRRGQRW